MKITIFFDFEGWSENNFRQGYDIENVVRGLNKVLGENNARAVFNTTGLVIEKYPELVKELHDSGHEIAVHGYSHENFVQCSDDELSIRLGRTEQLIKEVTGSKPEGIRCPWLYHDERIYKILKNRGYRWVSNKRRPYTELFDKPSFFLKGGSKLMAKCFVRVKNLRFKERPYMNKDGLIEIPLVSPMDGEIFDNIDPGQDSNEEHVKLAFEIWRKFLDSGKEHMNLNFHDWIIGTANRIEIFKRVVEYAATKGEFVLAKDLR
ncbi:polysaccharide deacetylase family protein [Candidatus Woesearchaeota archaeon]|nr:polysaccharide deacetylase family protein [Candidatus Woesearchaeota archaeon]